MTYTELEQIEKANGFVEVGSSRLSRLLVSALCAMCIQARSSTVCWGGWTRLARFCVKQTPSALSTEERF